MVWEVCSMDEQSRALSWTDDASKKNKAAAAAAAEAGGGPFACFHPGKGGKKSAEFLECDYEKNCTPLYRAIEDEDWEHVNHFLIHGYWPGKLFYDATSAADQARTWVTRYRGVNSDQVLWSQLPLHLCCILNAPYEIVSRLLEIYPAAARSLDDQTNLPLHIVLQRGASDQIVDLLLMSFPEAVNVKGKDGLTPLECADDKMVRGRVFKAIFGLDGTTDDQASRVNSVLVESNKQEDVNNKNKKATAMNVSNNNNNNNTSKGRQQTVGKNDASDGKNLKASVDVLRFNSLEFKTNQELAELRKELQVVASMAESIADVKELKSEIQNLRRQLRAKEHSAASAASAQQQLQGSRGSKSNKGKGKIQKSSSSSSRGAERPRSPFSRRKSGTKTRHSSSDNNRPGVQKSLSWSKNSRRGSEHELDNTDSVSLCSSVVSSKNHEYEVSMLPQASMLDDDSSDDSSDDDDSADVETESSSEQQEQPSPRQQPQQQQQQQERSKKNKKQPEKRRSNNVSQQPPLQQRQKKQQQQQQKQQQKQDFDSDQTDHDIILAHHPRQVDSRCQCVIL